MHLSTEAHTAVTYEASDISRSSALTYHASSTLETYTGRNKRRIITLWWWPLKAAPSGNWPLMDFYHGVGDSLDVFDTLFGERLYGARPNEISQEGDLWALVRSLIMVGWQFAARLRIKFPRLFAGYVSWPMVSLLFIQGCLFLSTTKYLRLYLGLFSSWLMKVFRIVDEFRQLSFQKLNAEAAILLKSSSLLGKARPEL